MGAGQIGGIATLLDIDFKNAAGFIGTPAGADAPFIVYYLSHAMLFCTGALIEPHVIVTPASCIHGERFKFPIYAGAHTFAEGIGAAKWVDNICVHRGYNSSDRARTSCSTDNVALLVLPDGYDGLKRYNYSQYFITRVRYSVQQTPKNGQHSPCAYYGWGSRRNGYLIPLLMELYKVEARIMDQSHCQQMFNPDGKFLCLNPVECKSSKYGALCPDDMGTVLVCNGVLRGMMVSRTLDRPCGVGFLDMNFHNKFLTCGVDDSWVQDVEFVGNITYISGNPHTIEPTKSAEDSTETAQNQTTTNTEAPSPTQSSPETALRARHGKHKKKH